MEFNWGEDQAALYDTLRLLVGWIFLKLWLVAGFSLVVGCHVGC